MANEITVTSLLSFAKGSRGDEVGEAGKQITMAGDNFVHRTMGTSVAAAAINIGSIGTAGWAWFRNNGATAINIRAGVSGADVIKLSPGKMAGPFELATSTPYAIAASGTPELEYLILEA